MINPNELRIGNLVHIELHKGHAYDGKNEPNIKRELHTVDANTLVSITYGAEHYFPIPLTPEILEGCGFKIIGEEFVLEAENRTQIVQTCFMDLWLLRVDVFDKHDIPLEEERLQYLHQLQNLYFALTGEELNVNLHVETAI